MLLFCFSFIALVTINNNLKCQRYEITYFQGLLSCLLFVCNAILGTHHLLSTDGLTGITFQYRYNLVTKMHILSFPWAF